MGLILVCTKTGSLWWVVDQNTKDWWDLFIISQEHWIQVEFNIFSAFYLLFLISFKKSSWEDPLEKEMATHSSLLARKWQRSLAPTVHGVTKSQKWLSTYMPQYLLFYSLTDPIKTIDIKHLAKSHSSLVIYYALLPQGRFEALFPRKQWSKNCCRWLCLWLEATKRSM